jgi:biopolymer transport protein ExbD
MAIKTIPTDDSALNMTPMIDIVFQLILFFLFNMRFKALDQRHEALLPKYAGVNATPDWIPPLPAIKAVLKRQADGGGTRVEVAGRSFDLPRARAGAVDAEAARDRLRDAIRTRIAALHRETGLPGEIDAPSTSGGSVAHGDVVLVLDAFVEAGVADVKMQGARKPGRR